MGLLKTNIQCCATRLVFECAAWSSSKPWMREHALGALIGVGAFSRCAFLWVAAFLYRVCLVDRSFIEFKSHSSMSTTTFANVIAET